jgi:hypothetical protein
MVATKEETPDPSPAPGAGRTERLVGRLQGMTAEVGEALAAQTAQVAELRGHLDAIRRGDSGGDPALRRQLDEARREIEALRALVADQQR